MHKTRIPWKGVMETFDLSTADTRFYWFSSVSAFMMGGGTRYSGRLLRGVQEKRVFFGG